MSVKIMSMVFDRYPEGGGEMLLALALADHANDQGESIRPSIASLAEKTRQSERSVQYQLRRMEESGWLILVNHGNGGRNHRREYQISPDWIKGAEIAPRQRVQNEAEKGATDDSKGCNLQQERVQQVAPAYNRHRTINEPSINHQGATGAPDGGQDKPAKSKSPKFNPAEYPCGEIPQDLWESFCAHRKQMRKPITEEGAKQLVSDYSEALAAGIDAAACVKKSIRNGWQGVFFDNAAPSAGCASTNPKPSRHQLKPASEFAKLVKEDGSVPF